MEPLVDTVIEDARWEGLGLSVVADRAAAAALTGLGIAPDGLTLCVMGCDDARIAVLNGQFRGKAAATNVLSWPAEDLSPDAPGGIPHKPEAGDAEDPEHLGDVALAFDTCVREAAEAAKPMEDHVTHLIVHGVLHLLGYDHEDDADAEVMEGAETRILASLGLADPYS